MVEHLRCHNPECRALWRSPRARRPLKRALAHTGLRLRPRRLRLARAPPATRLPRNAPVVVLHAPPLPVRLVVRVYRSTLLVRHTPPARQQAALAEGRREWPMAEVYITTLI